MIRLEYDPIKGETCPDGLIEERVTRLITEHNQHHAAAVKAGREPLVVTATFSNELFFHAFRVQVKMGLIPCEQVETVFNGRKIAVDKDGRCRDWPSGFCDHVERFLEQLFSH